MEHYFLLQHREGAIAMVEDDADVGVLVFPNEETARRFQHSLDNPDDFRVRRLERERLPKLLNQVEFVIVTPRVELEELTLVEPVPTFQRDTKFFTSTTVER